jgi:hypothetical protein
VTEPCPFCGARIEPIRRDIFKQCPRCGGKWYESGGGRGRRTYSPGLGGAQETVHNGSQEAIMHAA